MRPQLPSKWCWLILILKRWSVSWFLFLHGPLLLSGSRMVGMGRPVLGGSGWTCDYQGLPTAPFSPRILFSLPIVWYVHYHVYGGIKKHMWG